MDDFIKWIRNNLKEFIFLCVGFILFSMLIGLTIGLIKRSRASGRRLEKVYMEKLYSELEAIKKMEGKKRENEKESVSKLLLVPPEVKITPVIPQISEYGELKRLVEDIRLYSVSIQDLINSRTSNEEASIKAVKIMGKEVDIITINRELAEP